MNDMNMNSNIKYYYVQITSNEQWDNMLILNYSSI